MAVGAAGVGSSVNEPVVTAGLGLCVVWRGNRRTGGFVWGRNSGAVALKAELAAAGVEKGLNGAAPGLGRAAPASCGLTYLLERKVRLWVWKGA